jgi:hypothetical protein
MYASFTCAATSIKGTFRPVEFNKNPHIPNDLGCLGQARLPPTCFYFSIVINKQDLL